LLRASTFILYGELRDRPAAAWLALVGSLAMVAAIAAADYATGYELRLAILYLLPIALSTWLVGAALGTGMVVVSVGAWLLTFASSHPYADDFYFYWEGFVYGASFLIFVALLTRLRSALARSDERFVTVLESLDAAVCVEDASSGALLYGNRRFRDEFGAAPALLRVSGEVQDEASGRWYLVHSRPLRWTDGREALLRVVGEITEERRARELIERHRAAAHRTARLVALGEFASAIAHELNQPLAAIATYNNACLRLLQQSPDAAAQSPELRQAMEKCRDQAKRAGAIIQRLREVLRQPAPALASADLTDVARAALELAAPEALDSGVALELAAGERVPRVRADRLLIEQVALNLLRNAIESVRELPPSRRRVAMATGADAAGRATLTVRDTGDGVPEEARARLFDAFVTTKPGGLGLGLSICRSVIEAHGGSIGYEREAGGGARFTFWLPGGTQ
jgi:signal transduction histidine kinase